MTDLNKTTGLTSLLIASPIISPNGSVDSNPGPTIVNGQPVSAVLELRSTDGALLISRMTTVERDDMNPDDGMLIYNKTDDAFNLRVAGEWVTLVSIDAHGVENDIVVFGATQGSLKDSGVTIADFFPPAEFNNINALLAPGNDIAISQLSYLQFIENSGFVFLGLQAGVQLFSQPSPQNICVLVSEGGIPSGPTSSSCAFEINTRHGALLLSRMPQTTDMIGAGVDQLSNTRDGMMIFNSTSKTVQARRGGNDIGVDGVWSNVSTNPQNLKVVSNGYEILLTDDVVAVHTEADAPVIINLPLNPITGQTYTIYDVSGNADTSTIYIDGRKTSINGISPVYDKRIDISHSATNMNSVVLTPGNERAWYTYTVGHLITVLEGPLTVSPTPVTGFDVVGDNPRSIASNDFGNLAYVCCTDSDIITTITNFSTGDPQTTAVSYPGSSPWNIAVSGNFAYVTTGPSSTLNLLRIYHGANSGILAPAATPTISIASRPNQVVFSFDGRYAYVTALTALYIIKDANTENPSILKTIILGSGGAGCTSIAITPNGKYAYIGTNSPSTTVYIIKDLDTDNPIFSNSFEAVSCYDKSMAVTNNGDLLYISNMNANEVWIYGGASSGSVPSLVQIITGSTGEPITTPRGLAITSNDAYAYTTNYVTTGFSYSSRISQATFMTPLINEKRAGSSLIYGGGLWTSFGLTPNPEPS